MDTQETNTLIFALTLSIGIGGILVFALISMARQHKEKLELKNQNIIAELKSIEKERARMAADLHDDLAPMLAAIKMRLNSLEIKEAGDAVQVEKTNQIIDEMAGRMRAISFDLMPGSLLANGLDAALRHLAASFPSSNNLKITVHTNGPLTLNGQKSIHIYRVVKEIIHNTIKHANASELNISLEKKNRLLVLSTKDNGIGFSQVSHSKKGGGLGLSSIENRINLLKGKSLMTSHPGRGTSFYFEIPLP